MVRSSCTAEWHTAMRALLPLGKVAWEESSWIRGMKYELQISWIVDGGMKEQG